jgi:glycogen synthase
MRILVVSNFYPPYWVGGYEQIASWVAGGLRGRGHQVAVLTGRGPAFDGSPDIHGLLDLDLAGLPERYFRTGIVGENGMWSAVRRHVFSRRNWSAAARLIESFRPDLMSFWNPALVTFSPLLAARAARVPAVVHLSDTVANVFRNPHPPAFPAFLSGAARGAVDGLLRLARPARFVVPSAFLRQKFIDRERLPAERVEVVHWPVEPGADRATAVPRSGGSRLLFVGTLIPEKGVDVLVAALRLAHAKRPDLTLTLVGDGPDAYRAALTESSRGLPVQFAGRLDRAAVLACYARHDVLVFPSVWDEPFAVVPLEAMAMGLTVIATSAGGTPEAVSDGRTGVVVPPGDAQALAAAIVAIVDDPPRASRLAAAGQRDVRERLGFEPFMTRLDALYAAAVGSSGAQ